MDSVYGLCFNRPKDNLRLNIPDGISTGPILPTNDYSTELKTIKDIQKKFQYSYSTLLTPTNYNSVNTSFKANDYSNSHKSQIKIFNIEDNNYIAYTKPSASSSLSTFSVSKIVENSKSKCYNLKKTKYANNSQFYTGIDVSVFGNEAFALLLTEDQFEIVKIPSTKLLLKSKSKRKIADASLNKTLYDYFTVMEIDGTINVFNFERKAPCWSKEFSQNSDIIISKNNSFFSCQFGYHPQSIFVTCDENVVSLDTRMDTFSGNHLVFSLSNIGNSFEHKICSTAYNKSPYMYVNCTNTVYLIDERYVKVPIMSWNHLLPSGPNYSDLITINSENILVLGNSCDKQVCFISTKSNEPGSITPYVPDTCLPVNFYMIDDTLATAKENGVWYGSAVKERFSSQWLGISAKDIRNDKFYLWMENIFGDLMYQVYKFTEIEESGLNSDCIQQTKKLMEHYENSICTSDSYLHDKNNCCKVSLPCTSFSKGKNFKLNNTIYEDSKKFYWKIKDIIEIKRVTNMSKLPLLNEYKFSDNVIDSKSDYIKKFLKYRREFINNLVPDDSNDMKNKLALTWKFQLTEDSSSDECSALYDSAINDKELLSFNFFNDCKMPSSAMRDENGPVNQCSEFLHANNSSNYSIQKSKESKEDLINHQRSSDEEKIDIKDIEIEFDTSILETKKKRRRGF